MTLVLGALVSTTDAAKWKKVTPKTKLEVGDRVQALWDGQWVEGKIVGFRDNFDQIMVRFRHPDSGINRTTEIIFSFDRKNLRVQVRSNKAPNSSKKRNPPSLGSGNPFEPDKGFRKWTDDTGKFEIEAELVKINKDSVRLKRRDGRTVTVPLDRLSEKDRKLIQRFTDKPEDEVRENEEDENKEDEENGDGEDGEEVFTDDHPAKSVEFDNAMAVYFSTDANPSRLTPDSGVAAEKLTRRPMPILPKDDAIIHADGLHVASMKPNRIMLELKCIRQYGHPTQIVICDLAKNVRTSQFISGFPRDSRAVDFAPSGDHILSCLNRYGHSPNSRVDVWSINKGTLKHRVGWRPYVGKGARGRDATVDWAAFVDDNHVLTKSAEGILVLWKLPEIKAIYTAEICSDVPPAFSPGRKYLSVISDAGLAVINAKTGEILRCYQNAEKNGTIVFQPDGERIAQCTEKRLIVWNLNDSKPYRDIGLPVPDMGTKHSLLVKGGYIVEVPKIDLNNTVWPSKNYILVGGRYLVDLEKYLVLWDYPGEAMAANIGQQLWFLCNEDNKASLIPQSLPHAQAIEAIEKFSPHDIRGIEPGVTISLEIDIKASDDQRDQIRLLYEKQLRKQGFKIALDQPVKLVLSTKLGVRKKYLYLDNGGVGNLTPFLPFSIIHGDFDTVMFQQYVSRVTLTIDGKVAWKNSCVSTPPHHVAIPEDKSIRQILKKYEKPNIDFFLGVKIPSHVARPQSNVSFGASKITPQGMQSVDVLPRTPLRNKTRQPAPQSGDRRA